jgi:hypothetical protein
MDISHSLLFISTDSDESANAPGHSCARLVHCVILSTIIALELSPIDAHPRGCRSAMILWVFLQQNVAISAPIQQRKENFNLANENT